jgi:small-conductance mechanosensitive channel
MANYAISSDEHGDRIAINPEYVVSIMDIPSKRVRINLPDGGTVVVSMSLENAIAHLRGARVAPEAELIGQRT